MIESCGPGTVTSSPVASERRTQSAAVGSTVTTAQPCGTRLMTALEAKAPTPAGAKATSKSRPPAAASWPNASRKIVRYPAATAAGISS